MGLEHLIEKEEEKNCMEEIIREHYVTAICSLLFLISIVIYWKYFMQKVKKIESTEQITFINKFEKGDDGDDESCKDDQISISEQEEDGI